jgi:PAS domain S-box-containing protein
MAGHPGPCDPPDMRATPPPTRLERLLDALPDCAALTLDADGRVLAWSGAAARLAGRGADEARGLPFALLFAAGHRPDAEELRALATCAGTAAGELGLERPDGSVVPTQAVMARHDEGWDVLLRDLSAAHGWREALRTREAQLQQAERLAGVGSWRWDVGDDRVTWSDQLYRIYGLEPGVFGATFEAYLARVHPGDRERVAATLARTLEGASRFAFEERIVRPGGQVRLLRSRGEVERDAGGRPLRLIGACQDITEERAAEEEARRAEGERAARHAAEAAARRLEEQAVELETQAEELQAQAGQLEETTAELEAANEALAARMAEAEEANRAKAEFLAAMSHELRTPLNAIFGYADLIEMGVHGPVTPEQAQALDRIKRNQRYLLGLINDVLNFARVEAGKVEFRMADVPVAETLRELGALIEPQLQARGLDYAAEPPDEELRVRGDRERIEQVLLNLLTNAAKFTEPGGRVRLWCEAADDDDTVRILVSDTGCGIPAGRLAAIFDPFVQVHRERVASSQQGVGLGLAISRELARAMDGDMAVESREGQGSTFSLVLRRGRREAEGNIFAERAGAGSDGEASDDGEELRAAG